MFLDKAYNGRNGLKTEVKENKAEMKSQKYQVIDLMAFFLFY